MKDVKYPFTNEEVEILKQLYPVAYWHCVANALERELKKATEDEQ